MGFFPPRSMHSTSSSRGLAISRDHVKTRRAEIPGMEIFLSPTFVTFHPRVQACAGIMQQTSKINVRPEESVPVNTSYAAPKKSHDPWVHLLAGA